MRRYTESVRKIVSLIDQLLTSMATNLPRLSALGIEAGEIGFAGPRRVAHRGRVCAWECAGEGAEQWQTGDCSGQAGSGD